MYKVIHDPRVLSGLYNVLVRSHVEYASVIRYPYYQIHIDRIK